MTGQNQYTLLKETCPYLATRGLNETFSCCDVDQLQSLQKMLRPAYTLFSRCPACKRNFRDMFCEMTCSPNQSTFFDYNEFNQGQYYVTESFSQGLFDSCRDVEFPGSGGKVIDFMCGVASDKCTKEKFLKSIGSTQNGAPFAIRYTLSSSLFDVGFEFRNWVSIPVELIYKFTTYS